MHDPLYRRGPYFVLSKTQFCFFVWMQCQNPFLLSPPTFNFRSFSPLPWSHTDVFLALPFGRSLLLLFHTSPMVPADPAQCLKHTCTECKCFWSIRSLEYNIPNWKVSQHSIFFYSFFLALFKRFHNKLENVNNNSHCHTHALILYTPLFPLSLPFF